MWIAAKVAFIGMALAACGGPGATSQAAASRRAEPRGAPPPTRPAATGCALLDPPIQAGDWERAAALSKTYLTTASPESSREERSACYHASGMIARHNGDAHQAADLTVVALEIRPENHAALRDLMALAREAPEAYDFATVRREIERVYRERGDREGLDLLAADR